MADKNSTSERLKTASAEIMKRWQARARAEVPAASGQTSLILENSLPNWLDLLADSLVHRPRSPEQLAQEHLQRVLSSKFHGRSRAVIPAYEMKQLIFEYQILREVLFEVLEAGGKQLVPSDRDWILALMERAVSVAATEFADRLKESQEQFLLSIAHDLRSPITSAKLSAELVRRFSKAEPTFGLADKLVKDMVRMSDMVEKILDTSQIRAGGKLRFSIQECDLNSTVREVLADIKAVHGDRFLLVSPGPVLGLWNGDYLRRVIENLVGNAVKYGSPTAPIRVTLEQTEGKASIVVHNEGTPIPVERQATLFEGHEGHEGHEGWGLGLPLVKGVVDAFGGTVFVESSEQLGTNFVVELPKRSRAAAGSEKKAG